MGVRLIVFLLLGLSWHGSSDTECWITNTSNDEGHLTEDCDGAYVDFTYSWPGTLYEGTEYHVTYVSYVPPSRNPDSKVPHANIHSCPREINWCTPFVENTPSLATHTTALEGYSDANGFFDATSVVVLEAAEYTIIAHVRWDDENGLQHDMSSFVIANVDPQKKSVIFAQQLAMSLSIVVAVLLCCCACGVSRYLCQSYTKMKVESARSLAERRQRVLTACAEVGEFAFPMYCFSYSTFKMLDRIITYEEARDKHSGSVTVFDQVSQLRDAAETKTTIFVSHQWYGSGEPDPDNLHYNTIVRAIEALSLDRGLNPKNLWLWIDYTCIPQRSLPLQRLSIRSLPAYASEATFFLIVAPLVFGRNCRIFDFETYSRRGWCRLEQWARISTRGLEDMYFCIGDEFGFKPVGDEAEKFVTVMDVFGGEFTDDADRYALVDTVVGLYYLLLRKESTKKSTEHPAMSMFFRKALRHPRKMFPREYFEDLIEITVLAVRHGEADFDMRAVRAQGEELITLHSDTMEGIHNECNEDLPTFGGQVSEVPAVFRVKSIASVLSQVSTHSSARYHDWHLWFV